MTIVNSVGLPNAQLTSKENKSNGLFYIKTSFGIFAFCIFVFLLNLPKKYLYIQNAKGITEYLVSGYVATALYACLSVIFLGVFFVLCKNIKWRCIAILQVIFAILLHTLTVFLPSTQNQEMRFTQCVNVLSNLDDKAKSKVSNLSSAWLGRKGNSARKAQLLINSCAIEIDQSISRVSHRVIEISKPSTLLSLDRLQGRKIQGVAFSIAQEDKLVSCFDKLDKSGQDGREMMRLMITDLKRNGINQDPSFVINQCEANLALIEVKLNGHGRLESYWGQGG